MNKLAIFFLLCVVRTSFSQVPDSNSFALLDAISEVTGDNASLQNCISNSCDNGFDVNYKGSKDRLSNFRNYSTPANWDISTASYDSNNFDATLAEISFTISPDGLRLYILTSPDFIHQYSLSVAWDISTASLVSNSGNVLTFQSTGMIDIFIKPDGTKLYATSTTSNETYQYSFSTSWDITTLSYDSKSFDNSSQFSDAGSVFIKPDGTKAYIGSVNNGVYQYSLSVAWDISTASYDSKSLGSGLNLNDIFIKPDGTVIYGFAASQYSLSGAWDISTGSAFGSTLPGVFYRGLFIKPDGTKLYVMQTDGVINQYSLGVCN